MIGTGEGYLVGLSLGLTFGYPLKSPNTVSKLISMLLGVNLGLWFGYEAAEFLCCCRRLMDCKESTFWGVGISCLSPSRDLSYLKRIQ